MGQYRTHFPPLRYHIDKNLFFNLYELSLVSNFTAGSSMSLSMGGHRLNGQPI